MKTTHLKSTFSLKSLILGFILLGFTVLLVLTYWIRTSYINKVRGEALNEIGSQLLASGNVQIEEILPGLLLKEETGAIDYILERIKEKDHLYSATFHTSLTGIPQNACYKTSARSSVCLNIAKNSVSTIHRAEMDGQTLGYLIKEKEGATTHGPEIDRPFLTVFIVLVVVLLVLVSWVAYFLEKYVRRPILSLEDTLRPALLGKTAAAVETNYRVSEIQSIFSQVQDLIGKYQNSKTQAALGEFATQVAHDLVSPIASIRMMIEGMGSLSESDKKKLDAGIEKIRKIATTLRDKQKKILSQPLEAIDVLSLEPISTEPLLALIEQTVREKRQQYARKKISFKIHKSQKAICTVRVQSIEFQRALSNLLDNAVEAQKEKGRIDLLIEGTPETAIVTVRDRGKGIPMWILPKLMKRGATFGKKDGLGFGLYHAKLSLEHWGGKMNIESVCGKGTSVSMELPTVEKKNQTYISELEIVQGQKVVIIDDYKSMPRIWKDYLGEATDQYEYFSTAHEFESWFPKNKSHAVSSLFLVDHDLVGSDCNGLDVIEKFGIASNSVLVTGASHDPEIISRCQKLGVRLLPKPSVFDLVIKLITNPSEKSISFAGGAT